MMCPPKTSTSTGTKWPRGRRDPSIRAGRDAFHRALSDLVGELSTKSEAFRTKMGGAQRPLPRHRRQALHRPVVGDLELTYEAMDLSADAGLDDVRLHRRSRLEVRADAQPTRELVSHDRPTRAHPHHRPSLTDGSARPASPCDRRPRLPVRSISLPTECRPSLRGFRDARHVTHSAGGPLTLSMAVGLGSAGELA